MSMKFIIMYIIRIQSYFIYCVSMCWNAYAKTCVTIVIMILPRLALDDRQVSASSAPVNPRLLPRLCQRWRDLAS